MKISIPHTSGIPHTQSDKPKWFDGVDLWEFDTREEMEKAIYAHCVEGYQLRIEQLEKEGDPEGLIPQLMLEKAEMELLL